MLEAILIMSIIYAIMYMPLRGKSFDALSGGQLKMVEKNFNRYMKTRKGQQTPEMSIREYLPVLQKQALTYLIMAIVILPIYVLILKFVYPGIF